MSEGYLTSSHHVVTWPSHINTRSDYIVPRYILRGREGERDTDHIHPTFITVCYNLSSILLLVIVDNVFLSLIYKLNFIICIYVWRKTVDTGFHISAILDILRGSWKSVPVDGGGGMTVLKRLGVGTLLLCRNICNQGQNLSSSSAMMNVHWDHRYRLNKRRPWNRCMWSINLRYLHVTSSSAQRWSLLDHSHLMME